MTRLTNVLFTDRTIRANLVSLVAAAFVSTILMPAISSASTAAEHHERPSFIAFLGGIAPFWINFIAYVVLLAWILKKPFFRYWEERRVSIKARVEEATDSLEASLKRLSDAERRLAGAADDRIRIRRDIEKEAQSEAERIIANARTRAQSIMKAAYESAQGEKLLAERAVQNEIIEIAIKKAREQLSQRLTPQADTPFRETALDSVREIVH